MGFDSYLSLVHSLGLGDSGGGELGAYNLLMTRRWMLLAPRSRDAFAGIPVNALGFAGSLLVRDPEQLATLEWLGPMEILQSVAEPAPAA